MSRPARHHSTGLCPEGSPATCAPTPTSSRCSSASSRTATCTRARSPSSPPRCCRSSPTPSPCRWRSRRGSSRRTSRSTGWWRTTDGRIKIIPKAGASIEDMIRDVDEITAQVDPGAVFNPVVRAKLDAVHETSGKAMKWDLNTLSRMDDGELMEVLREMQAESEAVPEPGESGDEATDYVRAKIATIRRNVRQFQARHQAGPRAARTAPGSSPARPRRRTADHALRCRPRAPCGRMGALDRKGPPCSTSPTDWPRPSARDAASSASGSIPCSSACLASWSRSTGRRRRSSARTPPSPPASRSSAAASSTPSPTSPRASSRRRPSSSSTAPPAGAALGAVIRCAHEHELPVILDVKRGDIASTGAAYGRAAFGGAAGFAGPAAGLGADAVTASPYLGDDSLQPLVDHCADRPRRLRPHAHEQPRRLAAAGGRGRTAGRCSCASPTWCASSAPRTWARPGTATSARSPAPPRRRSCASCARRCPTRSCWCRATAPRAPARTPCAGIAAGDAAGFVVNASRSIIFAWQDAGGDYRRAAAAAAESMRSDLQDTL